MPEESKASEQQDRRSGPDRRKENRGIRVVSFLKRFLDRRKGQDRRSDPPREEQE